MLYNKNWENNDTPMCRLLNKAADLLEQKGHIKHQLWDGIGRMCFMGALLSARDMTTGGTWGDVMESPAEHVRQVMNIQMMSGETSNRTMVRWNNAPERTAQEVIDALRAAAKVPVA